MNDDLLNSLLNNRFGELFSAYGLLAYPPSILYAYFMSFDGYFEKIQRKLSTASSLEALVVWRKRVGIGNAGLSYKSEQGRLVDHHYTTYKEEKSKRTKT